MSEYQQYDFIIVGAGIVGPGLAVGLAKHGRKVLVLERSLSEPDRIVGELLQPGGVEALKRLGMEQAVEGIDAQIINGYLIIHKGHKVDIDYPRITPEFNVSEKTKVGTAATGRGFHHGRFVQNLRRIAQETPNVTFEETTVLRAIKNESTGHILGVIGRQNGKESPYFANVTIFCDGTNSKFRKDLLNAKPRIDGYFVGMILKDPELRAPSRGHVIIGDKHRPILIYKIGDREARILCDVAAPLPSASNGALKRHLELKCLPYLPTEIQPSFREAFETQQIRSMPNQFLSAKNTFPKGCIVLGDALNMRHPLTGGGMTVGLQDAAHLSEMLGPKTVDLTDYDEIEKVYTRFMRHRKSYAAVINILSIALYRLFSGASSNLAILQAGCFRYFEFGSDCIRVPASLLSGLLASPATLFIRFFSVALWAIYYNFVDKGIIGFPLALVQVFTVLFTSIVVFLPVFFAELF